MASTRFGFIVSSFLWFISTISTLFGLIGTTKSMSLKVKALKNHAPANYCDVCGLSFTRPLDWERHLAGKRHQTQLENYTPPESLYREFIETAPNWVTTDPSMEAEVTNNISRHWSYDELSTLNLKYRATCLHPSTMMSALSSYQKARIWRYCRDVMGVGYYSEMAAIIAAVDSDKGKSAEKMHIEALVPTIKKELKFINGRNRMVNSDPVEGSHRDAHSAEDRGGFIRIKELFESFESYKQAANFIVAAEKHGPVPRIVELGAGHGLVGLLLAYRFPDKDVILYDRQRRNIFDVFLRAFASKGHISPSLAKYEHLTGQSLHPALPNIQFIESDVSQADSPETLIKNSVVVCIHGCNEVNKDAIEMAIKHECSWIVLPCCIKKDIYLQNCTVILESDSVRHAVMVGALANEYNALFMGEIDSRITNRGVMIGGGVGGGEVKVQDESKRKFRGNLNKLSLS